MLVTGKGTQQKTIQDWPKTARNLTRGISPARRTAFSVLQSVAAGAYASDVLRDHAQRLNPRDAALASQIVYGCLRFQSQLDYLIQFYSKRRAPDLDSIVRIALRAGIFQLRYLDRIPAHAAVHDSVELVKQCKRAAAGLTNAVLRKVTRDPVKWPDEPTALSCPPWILDRWVNHFGSETARRIAEAALREPIAYIRVAPGRDIPAGVDAEPTGVAGCYRLKASFRADLRLHDIGSQAIVPLLDLRPGQSFLDLCAAPGNKTQQALEMPFRLAIACDISEVRIREIPPICPRVVLDATQSLTFGIRFDRIFIDAPCSGTGTLGRNPEIKWRIKESDFARLGSRQLEIASRAVDALAPGGKLLYASCSLEREENEDVVSKLLSCYSGLQLEREMWRLPGRDEGDGFYAALLEREL